MYVLYYVQRIRIINKFFNFNEKEIKYIGIYIIIGDISLINIFYLNIIIS